jgi:hypothetical protein
MTMTCPRSRVRQSRRAVLAGLIVATTVGWSAAAQDAAAAADDRTIMFVVDTSTSMAGAPLATAKNALMAATAGVPAGASVGVHSFGGPCDDGGRVRLPLGPFDPGTFGSAVQSLSIGASGTPTPAALRAAATMFPRSGDRTLVLVSDGGSSCGDPCPAARELNDRLGANFRIDSVGFRAPDSAESELDCIARVTGGDYVAVTDSGGLQQALTQSSAPRVTALRVSPASFAAAAKGGSITKILARKVGARVHYGFSKSATVRFAVERVASGRKVGGKCRRPTATNLGGRRCTRFVKLAGSFKHVAKLGANSFRFSGRLRNRKLRPDRYRLVATATDAAGNRSKPVTTRFVIKRR